jgi:hypothetical protein
VSDSVSLYARILFNSAASLRLTCALVAPEYLRLREEALVVKAPISSDVGEAEELEEGGARAWVAAWNDE